MVSVDVLHVVPSLIAHHSDWTLACIFCDMWDVAMIGSCVLLSPGHSRAPCGDTRRGGAVRKLVRTEIFVTEA